MAMSCLIQAQDKKAKGYSVDSSSNAIVDPRVCEQMPQFPGGEDALYKFIRLNLKYPVSEPQLQGKVICRFIVNADGSVSNPEIIRSLDPEYDKEAIRIVSSFPKFIPGKQNGKNVRIYYTLPIPFKQPKNNVRKK